MSLTYQDKSIALGQAINIIADRYKLNFCKNEFREAQFKKEVKELYNLICEIKEEVKRLEI